MHILAGEIEAELHAKRALTEAVGGHDEPRVMRRAAMRSLSGAQ